MTCSRISSLYGLLLKSMILITYILFLNIAAWIYHSPFNNGRLQTQEGKEQRFYSLAWKSQGDRRDIQKEALKFPSVIRKIQEVPEYQCLSVVSPYVSFVLICTCVFHFFYILRGLNIHDPQLVWRET